MLTAADLAGDLRRLGLREGDTAMAHVAFAKVGRCVNGPDTLIAALMDVVGPDGTLAAATDWFAPYLEDDLLDETGRVPDDLRPHIAPFDPAASRAMRDNGVFAEWLRTTPGAIRSANAGCSIAAIGARAAWLTADQPLDYGYGPGSPLARLVEARGRVLMIGAPWDTITLLHHAEYLADVSGKRVLRFEVPYRAPDGGTIWRMTEEYESSEAILAGLPDDYFAQVLAGFVAAGHGRQGKIGGADTLRPWPVAPGDGGPDRGGAAAVRALITQSPTPNPVRPELVEGHPFFTAPRRRSGFRQAQAERGGGC